MYYARALTWFLILGYSHSAYAQSAASTDHDQADIVVTAQKRSQNLNDVGITVSAFSGDTLTKTGVTSATQLVNLTPALNLAGSYGGQMLSFSIRGVMQQDNSPHAEGPVAVYLDDGYMPMNNAAGIGLFDLDHVEVLKGPQGTLFGRNATGGLVNIITRKPSDVADGYIRLGYGSYSNANVESAFGGPLADGVSFRLAGRLDSNGAYIHNLDPAGEDLGGQHSLALRAHLKIEPSSNLSILASGYLSRLRSSWAPYYITSTQNVYDSEGHLANSVEVPGPTGVGSAITAGGSRKVISNYAQDSGDRNDLTGATLKATWDFGPELTLQSDYKDAHTLFNIDNDGASSIVNITTDGRVRSFSQEARLFGHQNGWRWYAGAYYLHIDAQVMGRTPLPASGVLVDDIYSLKTNSYSSFGQLEFDLGSKLTAIGGLRITREVKSFKYRSNLYSTDGTALPLEPLGEARSPYAAKQSSTLYNAKLQLEYRPGGNYPPPCQFGRRVIHPACESR